MGVRNTRWEVGATAAAVLAAAGALRASLTFLGGAVAAPGSAAGLRGAIAHEMRLGATPVAEQASTWSTGITAVAAVAAASAAVAVRSQVQRRRSAVALRATRLEWYRKVQRVGGDYAVFDVTIPKPLGVKMEKFPATKNGPEGIGISAVVEGGNADEVNRKVCVDDGPGMWVLEGDKVMAVNGVNCEDEDLNAIINLVQQSGNEVTLTLMRNTRKGPIKVVLLPGGEMSTVRRGSRLSAAVEYAMDREIKYGCIDGWCGTCWHRERVTNGLFKPCCDMLTGDWDSVMPLVLTPKPEKAGDMNFMQPRGQ